MTAGGVDFFDDGLVVCGVAGKEGDGVGLCEFEGYGAAWLQSVSWLGRREGKLEEKGTCSCAYTSNNAVEVVCCTHC